MEEDEWMGVRHVAMIDHGKFTGDDAKGYLDWWRVVKVEYMSQVGRRVVERTHGCGVDTDGDD